MLRIWRGSPRFTSPSSSKPIVLANAANEVMNVIAKPLTDEDISQLAAWYASLVLEVKPP